MCVTYCYRLQERRSCEGKSWLTLRRFRILPRSSSAVEETDVWGLVDMETHFYALGGTYLSNDSLTKSFQVLR